MVVVVALWPRPGDGRDREGFLEAEAGIRQGVRASFSGARAHGDKPSALAAAPGFAQHVPCPARSNQGGTSSRLNSGSRGLASTPTTQHHGSAKLQPPRPLPGNHGLPTGPLALSRISQTRNPNVQFDGKEDKTDRSDEEPVLESPGHRIMMPTAQVVFHDLRHRPTQR